jgi:hypothetical protein
MDLKQTNKTILYYTSCAEKPDFEKKIQENILKNTYLPIISVSQKPIDFGKNICIGSVGKSYINEWRQILIGAKEATTDWLVFAESDFLYPREYFEFDPPKGADIYRYDNVWILFKNKDKFYRKKYSEGSQIVNREWIINKLEESLEGLPEWFDGREVPYVSKEQRNAFHHMPYELFHGEVPCISFKTGDGVRGWTRTKKGDENISDTLPHWGNSIDLKKKYEII